MLLLVNVIGWIDQKPAQAQPSAIRTDVIIYSFQSSSDSCLGEVAPAALQLAYDNLRIWFNNRSLGIYSYAVSTDMGGAYLNRTHKHLSTSENLQQNMKAGSAVGSPQAQLKELPPDIIPKAPSQPTLVVSAMACSKDGLLTWTLHSYRVPGASELQTHESIRDLGEAKFRPDELASAPDPKDDLKGLLPDAPSSAIPYLSISGDNADYINARVLSDDVLNASAVKDTEPASQACGTSPSRLAIKGITAVSSNAASSLRTSVANVATSFKEPQGPGQPFPLYLYYELSSLAFGAFALPHSSSAYVAFYDCDRRDLPKDIVAREYIVRGLKKHVSLLDNKNTQAQALQDATDDLLSRLACLAAAIKNSRLHDPSQLAKTAFLSDEQLHEVPECMLGQRPRYNAIDFADDPGLGNYQIFDIPKNSDWTRKPQASAAPSP